MISVYIENKSKRTHFRGCQTQHTPFGYTARGEQDLVCSNRCSRIVPNRGPRSTSRPPPRPDHNPLQTPPKKLLSQIRITRRPTDPEHTHAYQTNCNICINLISKPLRDTNSNKFADDDSVTPTHAVVDVHPIFCHACIGVCSNHANNQIPSDLQTYWNMT